MDKEIDLNVLENLSNKQLDELTGRIKIIMKKRKEKSIPEQMKKLNSQFSNKPKADYGQLLYFKNLQEQKVMLRNSLDDHLWSLVRILDCLAGIEEYSLVYATYLFKLEERLPSNVSEEDKEVVEETNIEFVNSKIPQWTRTLNAYLKDIYEILKENKPTEFVILKQDQIPLTAQFRIFLEYVKAHLERLFCYKQLKSVDLDFNLEHQSLKLKSFSVLTDPNIMFPKHQICEYSDIHRGFSSGTFILDRLVPVISSIRNHLLIQFEQLFGTIDGHKVIKSIK